MVHRLFVALVVVGALVSVDMGAAANVSSTSVFRAYNTSQQQYLAYGGELNTFSSSVDIVGQIPYQNGNPVVVSGNFSNLTYCYAAVTNGVGNSYWRGPTQAGQTGTITNQSLSLGTPPLVAGTALVVHCVLESGGQWVIAYQ
jgi:hypothetical protein